MTNGSQLRITNATDAFGWATLTLGLITQPTQATELS